MKSRLKIIKLQNVGGRTFKGIEGSMKHHLTSIEVHITLGLTRESFLQLSSLSEKDIRLMSKYGLPVK